MKKIFTSVSLLMALAISTSAQTTAPNWTAKDCNNMSHTLHTELNDGKVVVLVWVMPCVSCLGPAKTAYASVQNFAASHPDKIVYYMVDDYGDASCADLSSWVTSNNIGDASKMTFFDNTGNTISMKDFGGNGMPKVVVMGGSEHKIFFNKNNSAANDATGINSAITSALDAATNVSTLENSLKFSVSPNPVTDRLIINHSKAVKNVKIIAMNGQVVSEVNFENGKKNPVIELNDLPKGTYIIKIIDASNEIGIQKAVK